MLLFLATALAEIFGCYLFYLWLRKDCSPWWIILAVPSLLLFAYLLTLHPMSAGRTYAAYGGIYVAMSLAWLWLVEHQIPDRWDLVGAFISIMGMMIIFFGREIAS